MATPKTLSILTIVFNILLREGGLEVSEAFNSYYCIRTASTPQASPSLHSHFQFLLLYSSVTMALSVVNLSIHFQFLLLYSEDEEA